MDNSLRFPPGAYAQYVKEEAEESRKKFKQEGDEDMRPSQRRMLESVGATTQVLPLSSKRVDTQYYQVAVGNYGVTLPDLLNLDTLDGLRMVKGKASRIDSRQLAERIASETGGVLCVVNELYERVISDKDGNVLFSGVE